MIYYNLSANPEIIKKHYEGIEPYLREKLLESSLNKEVHRYIEENLKDIIVSMPQKLVKINNTLKNHKKYNRRVANKINKIFNYAHFITKSNNGTYDAYSLAQNLGIRTCLYCNRIYTITVAKGGGKANKLTRPEFDHFIDKSQNPLLALSIFNLIPSCKVCNSTLKGRTKFTPSNFVHPYVDNFINNYKYNFEPYDVQSIIGGVTNLSIKIELTSDDPNLVNKINNSVNIFKLKDIYSSHSDELRDIFDIRYRFSDKYLVELINKYQGIGLENMDIYKIVFGTYYNEDDFSKRPFSKLKKDILRELNIILPI